jgi:hypothetical protein
LTLSEAGRDEAPRKTGLVSGLDNQLDNAWQEGRWAAFLRAWLAAGVVATAAGFVGSLIMLGGYDLFSFLVFSGGKGWSNLLGICAGIAALAGGSMLIFTVPVMFVKGRQGQ